MQRLDAHGALAPGAAGVDVDALVAADGRRLQLHPVGRQVLPGEEAALRLAEVGHGLGQLALVEELANGLDGALAAAACGAPLHLDHAAEGARQLRLHQHLAHRGGRTAGEEGLARRAEGVARQLVLRLRRQSRQRPMEGRVHGEALLGELQGGGHRLLEGDSAVELQRREPRVGRGGGHRARDAFGDVPAVRGHVAVEGGGLGPPPQPVDGDRLAAGRVVEDGGGHAAEVGEVRQNDVDGDATRHPGVDGVSALLQDAVARGRRQVVPRGDGVGVPHHRRSIGWNSSCHDNLLWGMRTPSEYALFPRPATRRRKEKRGSPVRAAPLRSVDVVASPARRAAPGRRA